MKSSESCILGENGVGLESLPWCQESRISSLLLSELQYVWLRNVDVPMHVVVQSGTQCGILAPV